ncbi:MAG TPA: hypothetical protein VGU90_02365 [Terriglobales bacterium]|nr:hypothetical protein [Terriglobales bacterium]
MKSLLKNAGLAVLLGIVPIAAAQSAQDHSAQPAQQETVPAPSQTEPAPSQNSPPTAAQANPTSSEQSGGEKQSSDGTRDPNQPVLKRRSRKSTHRKTTGTSYSDKVVVRNGGAKDGTPQLAPGLSKEQELHNRENTNQLLSTTDANLKRIAGRQLTPAQQSMVEQVHTYVTQSKTASNAGDLNRAHTLAFKAHLLSDELAKK